MDHTTALAELLARYGFHQHALSRNAVGHLQLVGQLESRQLDILVDTGAASTVVDLHYCQSEGIATRDTGRLGGGAGGATLAIHVLDHAVLTLDGLPLRSDGIYAVDLSHVNQGLAMKGANRVHAVLGADVLMYHRAVIDYVTMSLFLYHGSA
jgi:hypothetical protein